MKVLITGSTGHLAGSFMKQYKEQYDFVGTTRKEPRSFEVFWDLSTNKMFDLPTQIDTVLHYAAIAGNSYTPENTFAVNCTATLKLLEWAKENGVKKFVYISTGSIYESSNTPYKESSIRTKKTIYGMSTNIAEDLCEYYSQFFSVVILRFFSPYGPNTNPKRIILGMIKNIQEGNTIHLHNNAAPKVNPIFITDLNETVNAVIKKDLPVYSIFNVGGNDIVNIEELANLIGKILNKKPIFAPTNKDMKNLFSDNSKIQEIIKPKVSLEEGIKKTVESMK